MRRVRHRRLARRRQSRWRRGIDAKTKTYLAAPHFFLPFFLAFGSPPALMISRFFFSVASVEATSLVNLRKALWSSW